jgi:hypothetical protein
LKGTSESSLLSLLEFKTRDLEILFFSRCLERVLMFVFTTFGYSLPLACFADDLFYAKLLGFAELERDIFSEDRISEILFVLKASFFSSNFFLFMKLFAMVLASLVAASSDT